MPDQTKEKKCPTCGEPIKANWRICPVCETNLRDLQCPRCGKPVKENWKRCPECEALLVCPVCQARLSGGETRCARCSAATKAAATPEDRIEENVCGIRLVLVPGGSFAMGDSMNEGSDGETPVHDVLLDDFYLGQYPVSQSQWLRLMPDNPSRFSQPESPVEQVSWHDAQAFIAQLNQAHKGVYVFSLPSEAQWEYAARSRGQAHRYAGSDDIEAVAWYEDNSQGHTHPVGTKAPNALDLYDMSGNVWEWCRDSFFPDAYTRHAGANPVIELPAEDRVIRGGSWNLDAWSARCARRFNFNADYFGPALGFRLAMKMAT